MIVDCHCHAGKGDGLTGPWDTAAPLEQYLRRAARAGIDRTVLFAAFHSDYAAANREVARIVASRPGRFYGFAFVHPDRDRGHVMAIARDAIARYGCRGIKVHRHDGRITREICDVARAFSLPVLYDVMGDISVCELLASEYSDVSFIIPHLGSFADDWRAQLALIDHLVRHPNVYADTSGVRRFDLLEQAVRRAGPRKILFGSDGPWLHPGVELEKVRALHLPPREEQLISGGNFLRLIARVRPRTSLQVTVSVGAETVRREPADPWRARRTGFDNWPVPDSRITPLKLVTAAACSFQERCPVRVLVSSKPITLFKAPAWSSALFRFVCVLLGASVTHGQ